MIRSIIAMSWGMLILAGCKNEEVVEKGAPFPAVEKISLLVIHHKKNGELIHYLALKDVPEELQMVIKPKDGDEEVFVTVLGKKRHALLKRSLSISSRVGEASLGKVTVIVENGLAISIDGNGFHSPALVSEATLEEIDEDLAAGKMSSEGVSTITITKEEGT